MWYAIITAILGLLLLIFRVIDYFIKILKDEKVREYFIVASFFFLLLSISLQQYDTIHLKEKLNNLESENGILAIAKQELDFIKKDIIDNNLCVKHKIGTPAALGKVNLKYDRDYNTLTISGIDEENGERYKVAKIGLGGDVPFSAGGELYKINLMYYLMDESGKNNLCCVVQVVKIGNNLPSTLDVKQEFERK